MEEKQWKYEPFQLGFYDTEDDNVTIWLKDVPELLNGLYEENQQLKEENKQLKEELKKQQ